MRSLDYVLLAVSDPIASAELYSRILGGQPVQSSPGFVLFVLKNGSHLGLWLASKFEPPTGPAGGAEISFVEADRASLMATYEAWKSLGLTILQAPTNMDFGYTFTAVDPDGHRLRPFVPAIRP